MIYIYIYRERERERERETHTHTHTFVKHKKDKWKIMANKTIGCYFTYSRQLHIYKTLHNTLELNRQSIIEDFKCK